MTIIKTTLSFVPGGAIPTRFVYSPDKPLEVTALFHHDAQFDSSDVVTWSFARSLLKDGLESVSGGGDVTVWPSDTGNISVLLDSPDGRQTLEVSRDDVEDFVVNIYSEVNSAEEQSIIEAAFDEWIAGFQSEGGAR